MQKVESPISTGDLIELINTSQNQCLFIKNENSSYQYANRNYIQLMGLQKPNQLLSLRDIDLSKNKQDANKYIEFDQYILEEEKPLQVCEVISPSYNQPLVKTMRGTLYPLFANGSRANYVLGIVAPECKLLKLDFDTVFNLSQKQLNEVLIKRSYPIQLCGGSISLSRMEIRTLVLLLKGCHAGEIAQQLAIKQTTVESYLINIKDKLAVRSKSELIQLLIHKKILEQIVI